MLMERRTATIEQYFHYIELFVVCFDATKAGIGKKRVSATKHKQQKKKKKKKKQKRSAIDPAHNKIPYSNM